ncbi:MAG: NADH-quinone oxidoreductase subunit C [Dehalococcoidia bacterium]
MAVGTATISGLEVADRIERAFPGTVVEATEAHAVVPADRIFEVAMFLRDDDVLDCKFLNSLASVDWLTHFDVTYHLSSLAKNHTLTVKARANHERPIVQSVTAVWMAANLQEREAYDLMGVLFENHPAMKRIFLWDGFPGHPLRKDFLALPGGFKPGLQRFPYEFPQGQRGYESLKETDAPVAPEVPRIVRESGDPTRGEGLGQQVTGAGNDPSHAGGTAKRPGDHVNDREVQGDVLDGETP